MSKPENEVEDALKDLPGPVFDQILALTIQLREMCLRHNVPTDAVINNVAWDAEEAIDRAYKAGRQKVRKAVLKALDPRIPSAADRFRRFKANGNQEA